MSDRYDLAIVGAGIVGLAHALLAARRGLRVVLFERSPRCLGASIRNFGMIWPIGQPAGELHDLALRSREIWGEVVEAAGLPVCGTGSLHAARAADEMAVLREFAEVGPMNGFDCEWLDPRRAAERSPALREEGLLGALWSPCELIVDPMLTIARLADFLQARGVTVCFGMAVTVVEPPHLLAGGRVWVADRVIVCSGDDFATLYPDVLASSGITRCKLQMLRTAPQPGGWRMRSGLAAGLTLRFYPSFRLCETMPALAARVAGESPEFDRWGIHVLASQTANGAVTIGDSHEYGAEVDIFDKPEIDRLILDYFNAFADLPDRTIAQRWHGVYAKHPDLAYFVASPHTNVRIVTATGGSGMSLSFGIAEETLKEFYV